jgi:hypothetical protein
MGWDGFMHLLVCLWRFKYDVFSSGAWFSRTLA